MKVKPIKTTCLILAATIALIWTASVSAEVTVEKNDHGASVKIDGQPFTEYLIASETQSKPVLWPIVASTGQTITRGFPIKPQPNETSDHPHQCGLWLTHGEVNGVMFWSREPAKRTGTIKHQEFTKLASGETGWLSTRNDWLDADGKRVCSDDRTFRFSADEDVRIIDVELILHASDGELKLGDNKEGSFGLRLADSIRVEAKQGGKIISSAGATNEGAWGKPAEWVDYHGPVDGKVIGVAILDHPKNPGHPTRWHVRPYGLFAANPFTRKAFDPSQSAGTIVVPAGESLKFRYRFVIHPGDEKAGKIAERYEDFAK